MTPVMLGLICGLAFGALAVAIMLPMPFPEKRTALAAAFVNRFGIGFLICVVHLPWPGWATGVTISLLLSLPAAIVTKAWAPILGLGAVGGLIIGVVAARVL